MPQCGFSRTVCLILNAYGACAGGLAQLAWCDMHACEALHL